jgi:hypothetical protein
MGIDSNFFLHSAVFAIKRRRFCQGSRCEGCQFGHGAASSVSFVKIDKESENQANIRSFEAQE